MKNDNIHDDLNQKEIRDFLAQQLRQGERKGGLISRKDVEDQIRRLEALLKSIKKVEMMRILIGEKGWKEWDASNYIFYHRESYFPFVGTEEEYNKFLELVKKRGKENDQQR